MFKRLSDRPVAEVQNQQVEKWKEEDLLKKCVDAREGKTVYLLRGTSDGQRKAGNTPCNGKNA